MPVPNAPSRHRTPVSAVDWLALSVPARRDSRLRPQSPSLRSASPRNSRLPAPLHPVPAQRQLHAHPRTTSTTSIFSLTFVVHRLIPRLPDEPADDQDRIVDAVLLEIPTGRVLARTTWHLHDHAQYLWNLGHGHFLLRIRDTLTTFAPLANLATADPFAQQPFIVSAERRIAAFILSPDADLLIIETVQRNAPAPKPKHLLFGPMPKLRLRSSKRETPSRSTSTASTPAMTVAPSWPAAAGAHPNPITGDIPATTAGYLAVVDQGHQHWAFDFHTYSGKKAELSPFDSTCSPAPVFVSHSEFIAFGCRGGQSTPADRRLQHARRRDVGAGLFGDFIAPSFAFAPAAGRFALSRIMLRSSAVSDQPISSDEVSCPDRRRLPDRHRQAAPPRRLLPRRTRRSEFRFLSQRARPRRRPRRRHRDLQPPAAHHQRPIRPQTSPLHRPRQKTTFPSSSWPVRAHPQPTKTPSLISNPPRLRLRPPILRQTPPNPHRCQSARYGQPTPSRQLAHWQLRGARAIRPTHQPSNADASPAPASPSSGDTPPEQHRSAPTIYTLPGDKTPANPPEKPQNASPQ